MKGHNLPSLLEGKLKPKELKLVYKSHDVVGDIATIRVPEKLKQHSIVIAEALMQLHKNVKRFFVSQVLLAENSVYENLYMSQVRRES